MSFARIAAIFFIGLWTLPLAIQGQQTPEKVKWNYDYENARRRAAERRLPMLLFFFRGAGNPWSDEYLRVAFSDHAIATKMNSNFEPVFINSQYDKNRLADRFQIDAYPSLIFVHFEGRIIRRVNHYLDAAQLKGILNDVELDVATKNRK